MAARALTDRLRENCLPKVSYQAGPTPLPCATDEYMVRTVSELAAAYENQAVRIETGVPPE